MKLVELFKLTWFHVALVREWFMRKKQNNNVNAIHNVETKQNGVRLIKFERSMC